MSSHSSSSSPSNDEKEDDNNHHKTEPVMGTSTVADDNDAHVAMKAENSKKQAVETLPKPPTEGLATPIQIKQPTDAPGQPSRSNANNVTASQDLKKTMIKTNASEIEVFFETFPYHLCPTVVDMFKSIGYLHLVCKEKFAHDLPNLSKFALISGPLWSEICKEHIALALAKQFQATVLIFDPIPLLNKEVIGVVNQLVNIVHEESKHGPLVVFLSDMLIEDIREYINKCPKPQDPYPTKRVDLVVKELGKMPDHVLVLASRIVGGKESLKLHKLFPNEIFVRMPQVESQAAIWKEKLKQDREKLVARRNNARIRSTLDRIGWNISDISEICMTDKLLTEDFVSRLVGHAVLHHIQKGTGKSVMSSESIKHGVKTMEDIMKIPENIVTISEFELKLHTEVIPPSEIGVTFNDIGGLEDVKDLLRETVMLPLQRPTLFNKGKLTNLLKGVLLFGPPGMGKTMVAKAVATEAGANFMNVSVSRITSKWHSESEKYVSAVFTLASKLAPCVIFIDEVDSLLSSRREGEHEFSRRMKDVFMTNWDGLRTKANERVVVLGATNRPFELDEAVIMRFPRRIMVGLPDSSSREKILRVILSDEELADDVDLGKIANMTDGYSGSDLKQLCIMAACCPIRQLFEKEKGEKNSAMSTDTDNELRSLMMDDFRNARNHVGVTCSESDNTSMLIEWNNLYGEGGSRKKQDLTYFI